MLALYEEVSPMLRANLYEPGKDAEADRAIALFQALDGYAAMRSSAGISDAFAQLRAILSARDDAAPVRAVPS